MRYGLPYKGSKNAIVKKLFNQFPSASNFYDLFMGGGAVTHYALLSDKYKNIYSNDIDARIVDLFERAIRGELKNETRWISREDFFKLKDIDGYIAYCWSFGNDAETYIYSREVESWKKALHYARVYGDTSLLKEFGITSDGSIKDIKANEVTYKEKYINWYKREIQKSEDSVEDATLYLSEVKKNLQGCLLEALKKSGLTQAEVERRLGNHMANHYFGKSQWEFPTRENYTKMQTFMTLPYDYDDIYSVLESLQSLQRLQRLQRLQSLQGLESLQRLQITRKSYDEVEILPDSVIYCDIPYENTSGYGEIPFDHKNFYDWACRQKEKIFISSYEIKDKRFICIYECKKSLLYSANGNTITTERLYIPKNQNI